MLFSVLVAMAASVSAQYTTVVTEKIGGCFPNTPDNIIVRNCIGRDYAVSYLDGPSVKGAFCAIDYQDYVSGAAAPMFPVHSAAIPSQMNGISDFRIVGDYVCFCGPSASYTIPHQRTSYFGSFKLSDLVSGTTVNYNLVQVDDALLERIEGFDDDHGFKVFALGYYLKKPTPLDDTNEYYAVFEVDNPPVATGCTVQCSAVPLQLPGHEFFEDIVILKDKVVFVCSHHRTSPPPYRGPIELRWVDKTIGIMDPQINTRYYQTSTGPTPEYEINSRIRAKPIDDELFVIGYTYTDRLSGVSTRRLRVFDGNLRNVVSQEYPIYSKLAMYEMAYNRRLKALTVLEPDGITSRFVCAYPLNTSPYVALTLQDAGDYHYSLDTISPNQFVSTRPDRWTFQVTDQVSYYPDVLTNKCIDNSLLEVNIIPDLDMEQHSDILIQDASTVGATDSSPVNSCFIKSECVSK